jgi:hypothetical protein
MDWVIAGDEERRRSYSRSLSAPAELLFLLKQHGD